MKIFGVGLVTVVILVVIGMCLQIAVPHNPVNSLASNVL